MGHRFQVTMTFEIENVVRLDENDKAELKEFIKDAVESHGGQRRSDDWLFGSLEKVRLSAIKPMKRK